jgi:hypothetical protein
MISYINQHLDPDLAHIFDASEVPVQEQYKLAVGGYKTLRRFACLGADVAEARTELKAEVGFSADQQQDPDLYRKERLGLAMLTDAWKAAQCHVERENSTRAEAKSHQLPVPVAPTTRVAMRKAIEALPSVGRIADREAPGAQYLSQKMEEVEQHMPTGSPLDEIVSVDDNDDYQLGPALDPSGAFRVVRKKMKVALPANNEELRLRLRVEGYTWMCLATKFLSRTWLAGQQTICWERYVDYILGPTVASLPIREIRGSEMMDTGRIPPFALVLGFEYELRKRVFKRVRDDGLTLIDSLKQAESDYEARELHFTSHLAYGSRGGSSGSGDQSNSRQKGDGGSPNSRSNKRKRAEDGRRGDARGGKGNGSKNEGKKANPQGDGGKYKAKQGPSITKKQLLRETPDGRPICFK